MRKSREYWRMEVKRLLALIVLLIVLLFLTYG